jgi:hypothetical protein
VIALLRSIFSRSSVKMAAALDESEIIVQCCHCGTHVPSTDYVYGGDYHVDPEGCADCAAKQNAYWEQERQQAAIYRKILNEAAGCTCCKIHGRSHS